MSAPSPNTSGRHRHATGPWHAHTHAGGRETTDGFARLDGLDLARGVAVLSMLIAHLSPVGGPANITENLTAPLFAVLIGVSMGVRLSHRPVSPARFVIDNLVRAVLLVLLGLLLQALYSQIIVILPYLGLLVAVLAPLALLLHRLPLLTLGLAAAAAVLSPLAMERARDHLTATGATTGALQRTLTEWVAAGHAYRLTSLLAMALGGLALSAILPRTGRPPAGYAVAAVLLGSSLAVYLVGYASPDGARAYSGTTAEIVGATLLAAGSVVLAFLLAELGRRWGPGAALLGPLFATGRLALTAYTLQVLLLAVIGLARGGAPDDGWAVLGATTAVVMGTCWALDRWWGTGPLEVLFRLARPSSWRPGGGSGAHAAG